MPKCNRVNPIRFVGLPKDPSNMVGGWLPTAIIPGARHNEVGECMSVIMMLVMKAQEILFSTINNIHSTLINGKTQLVLELVNPITLWILWKQGVDKSFLIKTCIKQCY